MPLSVPLLGGNESRYVEECIETNYVSSVGPFVDRFEQEFAISVGARHAVACSTGTAALHVALRLAGAEPGELVALSSFTFIASGNAVTYTGAAPLFVDSEPRTWNLDAELLHDEVVRRATRGGEVPKVIEVVHILGHPSELEPILALRDRFDIPIVEDAAESLGATYRTGSLAGRHVGTIGSMGCFSFNGNKIITTGGGGMIVTDDAELASRAKHLTTQAKRPGLGYVHDEVGYNYRLTNVAAAIGVAQLEQLPSYLDAKRKLAARYTEALAELPIDPAPHAGWADPSFWLYSVLLADGAPPRDQVLDRLNEAGVLARPLWLPLHRQPPYEGAIFIGSTVADDLYTRGLSLPSSVGLTDGEFERVVEEFRKALGT
ncbi:MAG: DegT/DnrJ/EryC1/StrS family aminotransferase [Actinobacteria bacterium]|nr:DegT/DnrJ/EryC1/StrS family aminotransferase [Actinomycetota bacterium]